MKLSVNLKSSSDKKKIPKCETCGFNHYVYEEEGYLFFDCWNYLLKQKRKKGEERNRNN